MRRPRPPAGEPPAGAVRTGGAGAGAAPSSAAAAAGARGERSERVVAALLLAAVLLLGARALWREQVALDAVAAEEREPFGFTLAMRQEALRTLPRAGSAELLASREARSRAVTEMELSLPEGLATLRLQAAPAAGGAARLEDVSAAALSARALLGRSCVYGLPSERPEQVLADLGRLASAPAQVARCSFDGGPEFRLQGQCALFAPAQATPSLEARLQLLAQKHGQPALFKWWPHVWGSDAETHHSLMQTVLPATSVLHEISSVHPVELVP